MEIRNITPHNANPNFGMAFLKPNKEAMSIIGRYVEPRSLDAFIKEQSKAKYFDIKTILVPKSSEKVEELIPRFEVVAKDGVDTMGCTPSAGYSSDEAWETVRDRLMSKYKEDVDEILNIVTGWRRKLLAKIVIPIAKHSLNKEYKTIAKNHPERMINPALRAAGDEVWKMEADIDKAKKLSELFDKKA